MPTTSPAQLRATKKWQALNVDRYRKNMREYSQKKYYENQEYEKMRKLSYYYFIKERKALFAMYDAMI